MIPNLAIIRIETPHRRLPQLWIPLLLLWIPVLLLSPLILLVLVAACIVGRVNPLRAIGLLWGILCSLPGTNVRVCADGNRVQVRIL
jgi:hypothetical protein